MTLLMNAMGEFVEDPAADADGRRASVYAGLAAIDARKYRREVEASTARKAPSMASRRCDRCGAEFAPRNWRQRYCGEECRKRDAKGKGRKA